MSPKTVVATPDVCKELERMARDSMGEEKPASKEALDAKSRMLDAYWLQAGPKTEVTPRVREFAERITGEGVEALKGIHAAIKENLPTLDGANRPTLAELTGGGKITDFEWSRTADDILAGRMGGRILTDEAGRPYSLGCGDFATLFIAIARAKGIPIKEVHTISEPNLRRYIAEGASSDFKWAGHVYAQAKVDDKWVLLNPVAGTIEVGNEWKRLNSIGTTDLGGIPSRDVKVGEWLTEIMPGGWSPLRVRAVGLDEWDPAIGIKNLGEFKQRFREFADAMKTHPDFAGVARE